MPHRRRRRGPHGPSAHPRAERQAPPPLHRAGAKAEARRRAELTQRVARLRRYRRAVGALAFVPILLALGCRYWLEALCVVPVEIYTGLWAGLFGVFLGLTIREVRERRRLASAGAS